jgi:hypothetical protein
MGSVFYCAYMPWAKQAAQYAKPHCHRTKRIMAARKKRGIKTEKQVSLPKK